MHNMDDLKVMIVEGSSDKKKVKKILKEEVDILCTNGTISRDTLETFIDELYGRDIYIFVDSDASGERLRKLLRREMPEAMHLYIDKAYKEVASAPDHHIASVLVGVDFAIDPKYLNKG